MSVIAAAVKHMLAAGMDPDAIVAAVADMELAAAPQVEPRSSAAIRQARYRARKAESVTEPVTSVTDVMCDVTDASSPPFPRPLSPQTPLTPTPIPPEITTPARKGTAKPPDKPPKRGTRLPEDWQPNPDDIAFAQPHLTGHEIANEAARFRDYWIAKAGSGGVKLDWSAVWRNWIRSNCDRTRRDRERVASRPAFTGGGRQGATDFAEIVARRRLQAANGT